MRNGTAASRVDARPLNDHAQPPGVSIKGVVKTLGSTLVLPGIDLTVERGEFVALLGPSGCGKTTLLRLIAGFEKLDGGSISILDRCVSGSAVHVPPERRNIGIVFQSFALWPHMSVAENVGYSLRIAGVPRLPRSAQVAEALAKVNLSGFGDRRPADLSGGQRQRVALARCLVARPDVILLDEPLANLDVHLRAAMEAEFARFHAVADATTLYVTHDQAEAMALAHRVAVMNHGKIVQCADPETLYRQPANEFVARFIGDGRIVDATDFRTENTGAASVVVQGVRFPVRARLHESARDRVRLCVRTRDLHIGGGTGRGVPGRISRIAYRGGYRQVEVRFNGDGEQGVAVNVEPHSGLRVGDQVSVAVRDGWVIPAPEPTNEHD